MRYVSSPQDGTSPHLLAQEEEHYYSETPTLDQHMPSSNSNKLPRRPVRFAPRQVKNRYTTTTTRTTTTTGGKKQCSPQTNHVMSDNYLSQQQQYIHPTSFMLSSQQPQQQQQQHEYLQQQQTTILSTPQPTCMQQLISSNNMNSQSYNLQQQQQQQQQYTSEYYGISNTFMQTSPALDLSMVEPLSFPTYNQQSYTYGNNNITNLNSPKMTPQSGLTTPHHIRSE
eukprot:UN00548